MKCSKCHYSSGDAWIQCDGYCPMWMSPVFKGHRLTQEIARDWYICDKCKDEYSGLALYQGVVRECPL